MADVFKAKLLAVLSNLKPPQHVAHSPLPYKVPHVAFPQQPLSFNQVSQSPRQVAQFLPSPAVTTSGAWTRTNTLGPKNTNNLMRTFIIAIVLASLGLGIALTAFIYRRSTIFHVKEKRDNVNSQKI